MKIRDARLGVVGAALLTALLATPSRADFTAAQNKRLLAVEKSLERAVAQAERACLSNVNTKVKKNIFSGLMPRWEAVTAVFGTQSEKRVSRGASTAFSHSLQRVENVDIRKCMDGYIRPALLAYSRVLEDVSSEDDVDFVDFRFAFQRSGSLDPKHYTEHLRLRAVTPTRPIEQRITLQDPTGEPYFVQGFRYPPLGKTITGTIVPERRTAEMTSSPQITTFCIQRGVLPGSAIYYDHYQCREGKDCQPSPQTTKLFSRCPARPNAETGPRLWKASFQAPAATATARPHWSVPSLQTLTEQAATGTGYTIFTLETDAFKSERDLIGVEVDLKVNGTPVDEDGLPPKYRPVAARPGETFSHSFGLETLNFEGAANGCERVDVSLTPLRSDGRRGEPRKARLAYVAFRDVLPQPSAAGNLSWSAVYMRPEKEWRNMLFVSSYTYRADEPASRKRMLAAAQAGKAWLDDAGYIYRGQPVVGVVRPPRTLQEDGSAAYGLIAGLRQPNGAVRFTFSKKEADALGAFLVARRGDSDRAADVIGKTPFVLATASGAFSLPGVCDA